MASKPIRPIRVEGNIAYIPLTKGYEAVIDAADVPLVQGRSWYALVAKRRDGSVRCVYAMRRGVPGTTAGIYLHRQITSAPLDLVVDHEDGDGLNNRRRNLRVVTQRQNMWNLRALARIEPGFAGVSLDESSRKWSAIVRLSYRIGGFDTADEAAAAKNSALALLRNYINPYSTDQTSVEDDM